MKTLITGATGMIGYNIALQLLAQKRPVRALVRSLEKGKKLLPPGVELCAGDITDRESLERAVQGCQVVYHAAGLPEQWLKNNDTFRHVNVEGTRNVCEVALKNKVKRLVYTSTIDVFSGVKGEIYDESKLDAFPKGTYYERSKQEADRIVVQALERGLDVVFLHPAGVFGPGPTDSPGTNKFMTDLAAGKVPMLLPGGIPLVYSEDVARGHILAETKAQSGSRYILCETYLGLKEIAEKTAHEFGLARVPRVMPLGVAKIISFLTETFAKLTGIPPLLPKGQLHFLQWQAIPSGKKAQRELGWQPMPFDAALQKTVQWMKAPGVAK